MTLAALFPIVRATKTATSERVQVPIDVFEPLTLPSLVIGEDRLFLNKHRGSLDANPWASDYRSRASKTLGVRHRKFYCTRHTFITEQVKKGLLLKSIADYCGTSVQMIEADYCGTLTLSDRTVFKPQVSNYPKLLASPTGFEPVSPA